MEKTKAQIAAEEYTSSKWSEDSREPLSGLECDIWKGAKEDYEAGYNTATLKWSDEDMIKFFAFTNDKIVTRTISDKKCQEYLADYKKSKALGAIQEIIKFIH